MACLVHKWNGCKCERCGKTRDCQHRFLRVGNTCMEECEICGCEKAVPHQFENGVCACGAYQSFIGYYLVGEKPDLSKKEDDLSDLFKPTTPATILQSSAKSAWQNWNDTTINFGMSAEFQIFFNAVNQVTARNPLFAERVKSMGELTTDSKKERLFHGSRGVVDHLDADFAATLDQSLDEHRDWAVDSEFYYVSGNEQFTQPSQVTCSYVPKWRIAIFFFHKQSNEASLNSQKPASILDAYRAGLSYLDGCGTFDEAKFREFNRITGNRFSAADIETQLENARLMIRGMEDLKQTIRSTTVEAIRTFEELEHKGIDLSKYNV